TSASLCCLRVWLRPLGSPTIPVKLPMIRTTVWPRRWNWASLRRTTAWPRVRWAEDGSMPSLTRSGRPSAAAACSRSPSPPGGEISATPLASPRACSAGDTVTWILPCPDRLDGGGRPSAYMQWYRRGPPVTPPPWLRKAMGPHFKKTVTLDVGGRRLELRVAQDLFSSHEVDVGTRLLLRTLAGPEHGRRRLVLDLGCGYGPLGLGLRAAAADRVVHLVDRDALAGEDSRG